MQVMLESPIESGIFASQRRGKMPDSDPRLQPSLACGQLRLAGQRRLRAVASDAKAGSNVQDRSQRYKGGILSKDIFTFILSSRFLTPGRFIPVERAISIAA
jgi:hypothetical protein